MIKNIAPVKMTLVVRWKNLRCSLLKLHKKAINYCGECYGDIRKGLDYYVFWKYMRSVNERVLTVREKGVNLRRDISNPEASAFRTGRS